MRVRTVLIPGLAAALSTAFVAGCADEKKAAETPKTEAAEAEPAKAEDVEIVLAKADEFDGDEAKPAELWQPKSFAADTPIGEILARREKGDDAA